MAAISTYLSKIMSAVLGEDVRSSIHDAIEAINNENVNVLKQCNDAKTLAQSAKTDAVTAKDAAETAKSAAETAKNEANKSEGNAALYAQSTQKNADSVDEKVADVIQIKNDLIGSYAITDSILDSSGDSILDSSGKNLTGRRILVEASDMLTLTKRVDSIETLIKAMSAKSLPGRVDYLEKVINEQ